ncbi:hypothetical protein ACQPZQ_16040 [Pseudonocardia sp. CA-142604]|uniref:hypothetical protein n=1 Tax=Pseudonocardia sp. CA-142604 TaxID=3240024 RepID=UPI003D8F65FD
MQYPVLQGVLVNQVATLDTRLYPTADGEDGARHLDRMFSALCPQVAHGVSFMDRTRRRRLFDYAPASGWS